jgi:Na+/phosphate symporter
MNKKANTILFILGATLFNIIVTVLLIFLLFIGYVNFLMHLFPNPEVANTWAFSFIFLLSLVIAFIVYRRVLGFIAKKIDMEKYFDPLFVRRHKS